MTTENAEDSMTNPLYKDQPPAHTCIDHPHLSCKACTLIVEKDAACHAQSHALERACRKAAEEISNMSFQRSERIAAVIYKHIRKEQYL